MEIDRNKVYEVNNYKFVNFINLDKETLEQVRMWRNHPDIRKLMYNTEEIPKENHFKFVHSLATKDNQFYWLVYSNDQPIGVVNLVNVDYNKNKAESGYYILPHLLKEFNGLEFLFSVNYFFFQILKLQCTYGRTLLKNINALVINKLLGSTHVKCPIVISNQKYIEFQCTTEEFLKAYSEKNNLILIAKKSKLYKEIFTNLIKENAIQ